MPNFLVYLSLSKSSMEQQISLRGKLDKLYDKWQGEIKSFEKELLEWKANQDREITDLQNKKHNLEEEIEKMKDVIKPIESVVTLNVGGQTYTTSLQTLVKEESMLAAMFSGRYKLTPDKDGNYFIDRDGMVSNLHR
jgi:predicted  nucleic acid-binding Zn-ribbon protein